MGTLTSQLRAYRVLQKMTQEELAQKLGISRRTIATLEQCNCSPSLLLAYRIAKLFHCAIEDIFIYQK
jgi:putative transcriptional regulator